jgi:hypothetical protein
MSDQISAFPVTDTGLANSPQAETGMSLRDYFAAKAMQGIMAADPDELVSYKWAAERAYKQADAMIKEREK